MPTARPGLRRRACLLSVLTLLLAGARARAQTELPSAAVETQARALLAGGKPGQAIALLKPAIARAPLDESLRLLLARAYLDDGNDFWALRTLSQAAEVFPEDCNLGLWQAWIEIRQGALDEARALLDSACSTWSPQKARRALLRALVEQRAQAPAAAQAALDEAHRERFAYPEDRAALAQLQSELDPGFLVPLTGRLDFAAGFASNARAGSPVDPADAAKGAPSPLFQIAGFVRFVSPHRFWARPALTVAVHGLDYTAAAGRDFSYLMLDGRPELLLGPAAGRVTLAYRYQTLLMAAGDSYAAGPLWFFDAHRGELELELWRVLTVFGGAGHRRFRELGRTRFEVDGGVGGGFAAGSRLHFVGALAGRYYDAQNDAWDLRGVSLLASAEIRLPRRWSLRAGLLLSADRYPRSAGYFDPAAPTTTRQDSLLKLSASGFSPPLVDRLKLGLTYEYANRDSTAVPYDYEDHRVLAKLIWTFAADPWLPHAASPAGHVPLDYGLGEAEVAERVQDLLRQDEAAQRSSSCRE
jgi:hypothetical protein